MTSIAPTPSAPVEQEPFDASLRRRAKKVIPGGLWGHMNAARLPEGYPQYFARARGCRLWDVDDNEYVDFMCSYGPMILGYGDEDVERAAARQRAEADIANGPAPCAGRAGRVRGRDRPACRLGDLRQERHRCHDHLRDARARRHRAAQGLVARGAYHGAVPWCTPSLAG